MQTYLVPMVPGPVRVPSEVLEAYQTDFGSGDLEPEFADLYRHVQNDLQQILKTRNRIAIQTGEGMLALWSALKSCLLPGDRVLAIATGVFGFGIADMARTLGANVRTVALAYDQSLSDMQAVERAIVDFEPQMITVVHCETPSGTLNPLAALGEIKRRHRVPLLYVDAVASIGGVPLHTDAWHIDLCLGATQKVLSGPPGLAFVAVSEAAWACAERVAYAGYDALLPFRDALENRYWPYTPYWHGMAALKAASARLLREGLIEAWERHEEIGRYCRALLTDAGLTLFAAPDATPSPTVTAVRVPEGIAWAEWDARLRRQGLVVGGSFGPLAGNVFRLGHMGTQADLDLVTQAAEIIAQSLP